MTATETSLPALYGVKPGATHCYATTMPKPPVWAKGAKQTLKLGHHVFFKDVP